MAVIAFVYGCIPEWSICAAKAGGARIGVKVDEEGGLSVAAHMAISDLPTMAAMPLAGSAFSFAYSKTFRSALPFPETCRSFIWLAAYRERLALRLGLLLASAPTLRGTTFKMPCFVQIGNLNASPYHQGSSVAVCGLFGSLAVD
jgi:hypothetical protein